MRFEMGDVDVMSLTDLNPPDFLRLQRDQQWRDRIEHAPMMDVRYVCMNTEKKPFNNVLVRRAVSHAINRQRIGAFRAGRATLARGALPPECPLTIRNCSSTRMTRKKLRITEASRVSKRIQSRSLVRHDRRMVWQSRAVDSARFKADRHHGQPEESDLRRVKNQSRQARQHRVFDDGLDTGFPDPSNFLVPLFSGKSITPTSSLNRSFYNNPEVNKLLNAAQTELNEAKRMEMYRKAEGIIVRDAPLVFLHHTERYVVHQPWVRGYRLHPMWTARYEYVSIDK
jgi:peptide/nickel transport system substrate-binding protein